MKKTLTVNELIEKLNELSCRKKKLPVFMATDRSDDNHDEDGHYIQVHPIEFVSEEIRLLDDGLGGEEERSIVLEIPE